MRIPGWGQEAMKSHSAKVRGGLGAAVLGVVLVGLAGGANGRHPAVAWLERNGARAAAEAQALYRRTPADQRVTWGGLIACAALALGVALERLARVQRSRIIPKAYTGRFHDRLVSGKLDRGKALDFCELNPSPAARVVLAAVRRWGRPASDMERAVALARGIEVDHLRRHVPTLRRIAALAPLIGLMGTLLAAQRGLSADGAAWAPAAARSLVALTSGVALAILCLVAYDGLSGRVEALASALDRLGAEAVDAIAMASAPDTEPKPARPVEKFRREPASPRPTPHARRAEIPLEDAD